IGQRRETGTGGVHAYRQRRRGRAVVARRIGGDSGQRVYALAQGAGGERPVATAVGRGRAHLAVEITAQGHRGIGLGGTADVGGGDVGKIVRITSPAVADRVQI